MSRENIGHYIIQYGPPTALTPKEYAARSALKGSVDWGPDAAAPRPGTVGPGRSTGEQVA